MNKIEKFPLFSSNLEGEIIEAKTKQEKITFS